MSEIITGLVWSVLLLLGSYGVGYCFTYGSIAANKREYYRSVAEAQANADVMQERVNAMVDKQNKEHAEVKNDTESIREEKATRSS